MPTDRSKVSHLPPAEAEATPYPEVHGSELHLAEARRLAHEIEAILVEAAKDPAADAYALRIAQGLARSLIDQLVERPNSSSHLPTSGHPGSGSVRVA
jgi:hypothetical protein